MTRQDDPVRRVAAFYDQRVTSPGARPVAGLLAPDYTGIDPDLMQSSFGCGNPLAFADVQPGQTVLDLGCGAGLDLVLAADRVGPDGRVIGIDAAAGMVARARERAVVHPNVTVLEGRIEALPLPDASVDHVISNCVVNLSPDKPAVFSEIARVLRPGGRMLIADIAVSHLPEWLVGLDDLHAACIAGAVPEQDYLRLARVAGLAAVTVEDRIVHDAAALAALISDELPEALADLALRLATDRQAVLARLVTDLEGRVAGIKLGGRKPA